jgi:lysozyme
MRAPEGSTLASARAVVDVQGMRRAALVLASCIGLGSAALGCADDGQRGERFADETEGQAEAALVVCAPDDVVYGIDVSYYQGDIDWSAVAADGYAFAITRINHADFMDPKFDANWAAIKDVGLVRGAYQYFEPGDDPVWQAEVVVAKVGKLGPGDLPVVIDVETTSGLTDPSAIVDSISAWMDIVEVGTGKQPIVYTGKYFWQDNVASDAFADYPLWHAQYPNACQPPAAPPPACGCANVADQWSDWLLWQYTSSGSVAGISGNVDTNVFKGNLEDLVAFASQGGYGAVVDAIESPSTVLAGEVFQATIAVTNVGGSTWTSSTHLGTTEPRDRASVFAHETWASASRPAMVAGEVGLGESYVFEVKLAAPTEPGTYVEHFGLVEEGEVVAWFGDEAGPDDAAIALTVQVVAAPPGGGGAPSTGEGAAAGGVSDGAAGADGGNDEDGCSTSPARSRTGSEAWASLALALGVAWRRRALR